MPGRRYVKEPGAKKGYYLPCENCGKVRCECLELKVLAQIASAGLPTPVREFEFAVGRKWRADFAYPEKMILIEVEGGGGIGRHTSVTGFREDCVKYTVASLMGYRVIRIDSVLINRTFALNMIRAALNGETAIPAAHTAWRIRKPGSNSSRKSPNNPEKSEKNPKKPGKNSQKSEKGSRNIPPPIDTEFDLANGLARKIDQQTDPVEIARSQVRREQEALKRKRERP